MCLKYNTLLASGVAIMLIVLLADMRPRACRRRALGFFRIEKTQGKLVLQPEYPL